MHCRPASSQVNDFLVLQGFSITEARLGQCDLQKPDCLDPIRTMFILFGETVGNCMVPFHAMGGLTQYVGVDPPRESRDPKRGSVAFKAIFFLCM